MKKFLTFVAAILLSIMGFGFNASASTVYLYFQDGEEDDFELMEPWDYVSLMNWTTDEYMPLNEGFLPFEYEEITMLKISPADLDFELTVSVEAPGDDSYMLEKEDGEWFLTLFPEAGGAEIFVRVYLAGQAPSESGVSEVSMNFNISAVQGEEIANPSEFVTISYFDKINFQDVEMTIENNSASATVVPGTSFEIIPAEGYVIGNVYTYLNGIASISEPGEGENIWHVSVSETPAGDFASFFVEVAKAPEEETGAKVTFNFSNGIYTMTEDVLDYINIWNDTDSEWINPTSTTYIYEYEDVKLLRLSADGFDYEITVKVDCDDEEGYMLYKEDAEWYLTLFQQANGATIWVELYPEGQAPKGDGITEVSMNFNITAANGSGIENPSDYLTLIYFDKINFQDVEMTIDDNFASATVVSGTSFEITPAEGYMITGITSFNNEGIASISDPADPDGVWNISVDGEPTGDFASFFIEVGKSQPSIMLNFKTNSSSIHGNPQDFVTVTSNEEFELKSDENKVYIPADGLTLGIAPIEKYEIANLAVTIGNEAVELKDLGNYGVTMGEAVEGSYAFTITSEANGLVFTFTISEEGDTSSVNGINAVDDADVVIYNLQGIRVDASRLVSGVYIVNGKKVYVRK